MTKKNLSIFIVLIGFIFLGCSTQPPDITLNTPLGLTGKVTSATSIAITFFGYNPEKNFTGYNIYIALNASCTNWANLQALSKTETNAISSIQITRVLPTFPPSAFPVGTTPGITYGVTKLDYTANWDYTAAAISFPNTYCFGVRAIDLIDGKKSIMSNAISCATVGSNCTEMP